MFCSPEEIARFEELDTDPIPETEDREGYYGDRHYEYWISGAQLASRIESAARKYNSGDGVYVELGASTGRVVRHLACRAIFNKIWAFDINWRHVVWMQRHLSKNIIPVQNSSLPTLPIECASVDVFSAWSVFSHIETFEMQWLSEIRRILKPGGIALLSVVTENQIRKMDESWPMFQPLTSHSRWSENFVDELEDQGKIVLRWANDRSYSSNVIYSAAHIHNLWSRLFDIVEYVNQYPDYQDMVILRKPNNG